MRVTYVLALLPLSAASPSLFPRQGALNNPCRQLCELQATRDAASIGCTDNSVCLCSNPSFLTKVESCLKAACPQDTTDAILTQIRDACATWVPMTSSVSRTTSKIPETTVPVPGVVPLPSSTTPKTTAAPVTGTGNGSGSGSGNGNGNGNGNAGSSAGTAPAAGTATPPVGASSSRAWALPTAVAGMAGVVIVAVGAIVIV